MEDRLHVVARLCAQLQECRSRHQQYEDYYNGDHRLSFVVGKYREAFGDLLKEGANNWCRQVVNVPAERLRITSFRFGQDSAADELAWQIWQSNRMDSVAEMAHKEAIKHGVAYLLVDFTTAVPGISVQHPLEFTVERSETDRRQVSAALKRWVGPDNRVYATLYEPDAITKWVSDSAYLNGPNDFQPRDVPDQEIVNPLGLVPVVPLENDPSLMCGGTSDLIDAIPLNDYINKLLADMMVASEIGAFRQRVITGLEVPRDPETGAPIDDAQLRAAMARVWAFEPNSDGSETKVFDLNATELQNFVTAKDSILKDLAAKTRLPPHYIIGDMTNLSADALRAAETGLAKKVAQKQMNFGDAWEDAMRLCFLALGQDQMVSLIAETQWAPISDVNMGEMGDYLSKLSTFYPLEVLWQMNGATDQEIARWGALMNLPKRPAPQQLTDGTTS